MKLEVDADGWKAKPAVRSVVLADDLTPVQYLFVLKARTDVIHANVTDGGAKIELFPERSGAHRALRDALA